MTDLQTQIKEAVGAHGAWKLRLRTAITTGRSDTTPEVARCDDRCTFGKWLYGSQVSTSTKSGTPYQVVKRLHRDFHEIAGGVLALAVSGDKESAERLLSSEYTERSEKLVRALNKWRCEAV